MKLFAGLLSGSARVGSAGSDSLRGANAGEPSIPTPIIAGDEALQLTGWPAGFDFDAALGRTDAFGRFILKYIQATAVAPHQRELRAIAEAIGWQAGPNRQSPPILATVTAADSRTTSADIRIGPHSVGSTPRGSAERIPAGSYAATLGSFGDILGLKVYLTQDRPALL